MLNIRGVLFFVLFSTFCYAQPQRCSTMIVDSMRRAVHPELGTLAQFEGWLQEKITEAQDKGTAKMETSYMLPVVVHVIHNGQSVGVGMNISDVQIQSQIDVLNEDYRKWNTGIAELTTSPFNQTNWSTIAADCGINFCMAKKDPNGNAMPSQGIDRVNVTTKGLQAPPYDITYIDNSLKPATIWDPNKYLNIWTLDFSASIIGYATFPVNSTLTGLLTNDYGTATTDGVVIAYQTFGRTGNVVSPYNKGRTATHEIGHWLGLRHIWGEDAPCGSDYCNDTPTQAASNDGVCPVFPHISCTNNPNGDMFINYMDYSSDACMRMFTNDQKTRMQTVMAKCPFRLSLATQSGNCGSSAIDELDEGSITVYPNPGSGEISILFPYQQVIGVELLNTLAERIYMDTENKFTDHITLNLPFTNDGIYFLKIHAAQTNGIKKIVIHN